MVVQQKLLQWLCLQHLRTQVQTLIIFLMFQQLKP